MEETHISLGRWPAVLHTLCDLRRASLVFALTICVIASGCIAPKRSSFIVPRRCLKIDAQSFTRPCVPRADGKLVCDGVIIQATCVEASH